MHESAPSAQRVSTQFARLHPTVQRWIYDQGWRQLRDIQERAVAPILAADRDAILAAATASGKTEAAWLPIASTLLADPGAPGVAAVYIGPLKALINDQYERLTGLFGDHGVAVHRWHGDVPQSQKQQVLRAPSGVLLITPESLEALFVNHGGRIGTLLAGLRYVVVDELHSFIGTERGAQLQALLHRVELVVRRGVPRIGLSATLGDFTAAADFLRPGRGPEVTVVEGTDDGSELRLQVRGYVRVKAADGDEPTDQTAIVQHLFKTLRGTDNLVFANSRAAVETYTDRLTRMSEQQRVPNEFLPHHGNLAKDVREHVEQRLKDRATPVTALCTSTLEMGIDIGSVDSVAQLGPPGNVAALRQRLGRSGRRVNQPAVLRLYVTENALDGQSSIVDTLRTSLFQTVAVVELLLARWYEPPDRASLHLSTLTQQILSVIAQRGGATPTDLYAALCGHGPFARVDPTTFTALLRCMGAADLLTQDRGGLLLAGGVGDRLINHYTFYAAFKTVEEYRLIANGRSLGTLPIDHAIIPGMLLIFSGRRWEVLSIDGRQKVIDLTPSAGGRVPPFLSGGGAVADEVRRTMRELYRSDTMPRYLDPTARELLGEGRAAFKRLRLDGQPIVGSGTDILLFPWRGDKIMDTLMLALAQRGVAVGREGAVLVLRGTDPGELLTQLGAMAGEEPPSPADLATLAADRIVDKYDEYLSDELAIRAHAARAMDVPGAWNAIRELAAGAPRAEIVQVDLPHRIPTAAVFGQTPLAVVDVETTGFAAHHHDRLVEIAVVRLDPDGRVRDRWTTLLNPDRNAGPTHTHGLTDDQLHTAPRFANIAADLAERLTGHVIVAHNARFDLGFITAEYRRLGVELPPWPTICTLELADRLGIGTSRRLGDCCAAAGIQLDNAAHTALGDATATAALLQYALSKADPPDLASLGCRPVALPTPWISDDVGLLATVPTKPELARSDLPAPTYVKLDAGSFAGITTRIHAGLTGDHRADAYLDVLDRALRDGVLTEEEGVDLIQIAHAWGLTRTAVQRLNSQYLAKLADVAPSTPTIATRLAELSGRLSR